MRHGDLIASRYLVVQGPAENPRLQGGMGVVYLCVDRAEDDRPVALKTFHADLLSDRGARDRFLREADVWVRLGRHPHIVRAHNVERVGDGQEVYVVADWVAGAEGKAGAALTEYVRARRPVERQQALRWALEIVRGLRHATGVVPGLVHRDLKPGNVLVGPDGMARVTDFGLARAAAEAGAAAGGWRDGEPGDTPEPGLRPSVLMARGGAGTPEYMAPEQWDGVAVDLRADVYALGCVMVELLTGEAPVQARPREGCRALHASGAALRAAKGLGTEIEAWLGPCLAVRREDRYPTWEAVEGSLVDLYLQVTGEAAPALMVTVAETTRDERVATGWSLNEIGGSYLDLGEAAKAAEYFERARAAGVRERDRPLEAAGLGNLGIAYQRLGEVRRAIGYCEQHLAIAREVGARAAEGAALGNLGIAHRRLGEMRRAIGYLEQALAIAQEVGDRADEGLALGNLGNAYLDYGEVRRAIGYYEQALAIAREVGNRTGEGRALGGLGNAYLNLGQAWRAIAYYEQALTIAREVGERADQGEALGHLGIAYANLEEVRRAIGYYELHLAIAREVRHREGEARSSFNLALLCRAYDPGRARAYADAAARLFREIGHAEYAARADQLRQGLRR